MRDYHSNQRKHRYKNGHYRPLLYDAYKKSSILSGHVWESFARNGLATILVVAVAFLVGFRPKADFAGWLLVLLILSLYILAISWCSIFFGIIAKSPEGAGAFSVFAIILPYLSSGFVPTDTMPKALELFAEHQPMTPIIDTLRTVLQGKNCKATHWQPLYCGVHCC